MSFSAKKISSLQTIRTKFFYWKIRNKRNFFKKSQILLILQMQRKNWVLGKDLWLSKCLHTVKLQSTFWKLDLKIFLNTFVSKKIHRLHIRSKLIFINVILGDWKHSSEMGTRWIFPVKWFSTVCRKFNFSCAWKFNYTDAWGYKHLKIWL